MNLTIWPPLLLKKYRGHTLCFRSFFIAFLNRADFSIPENNLSAHVDPNIHRDMASRSFSRFGQHLTNLATNKLLVKWPIKYLRA